MQLTFLLKAFAFLHLIFSYSIVSLFTDGASFAFSQLAITEQDPKVQELVNENPGEGEAECPIEAYQYLRLLNISGNELQTIDRLRKLEYLYELNASDNQINEINLLTESQTVLKFL